jgi:hypothetical protein
MCKPCTVLVGASFTVADKELSISLWLYSTPNRQIRRLGKGRIAFDLWRLSLKFEIYTHR